MPFCVYDADSKIVVGKRSGTSMGRCPDSTNPQWTLRNVKTTKLGEWAPHHSPQRLRHARSTRHNHSLIVWRRFNWSQPGNASSASRIASSSTSKTAHQLTVTNSATASRQRPTATSPPPQLGTRNLPEPRNPPEPQKCPTLKTRWTSTPHPRTSPSPLTPPRANAALRTCLSRPRTACHGEHASASACVVITDGY